MKPIIKKSDTKTSIEVITPEMAQKYLGTNISHQRNVTMSHVLHLRQQMESEQWLMTGEPIIFDELGRLVDGQHRLRALVAAGASIEFVIIRGVPTDSFMAMNRGKTRTNANVLSIHGVQNYSATAACVANVLNYRRALAVNVKVKGKEGKPDKIRSGSLNSYIRASSIDVVTEHDLHPASYSVAVDLSIKARRMMKGSVTSTVAALALIDADRPVESVCDFWDSFVSGANLGSGHPALALRNAITVNNNSTAKLSQSILIMMAVRAWNKYITGESAKVLKVNESNGVEAVR